MTEAETETEGSARRPAPQAAVTSAMSSDPGHGQESFLFQLRGRLMEAQGRRLWSLPLFVLLTRTHSPPVFPRWQHPQVDIRARG